MPDIPIQGPLTPIMTLEELYRQYGEATIQFKICQSRVVGLEQQIQQVFNQAPPTK